jgi:hypothetical protein
LCGGAQCGSGDEIKTHSGSEVPWMGINTSAGKGLSRLCRKMLTITRRAVLALAGSSP